MRFGTFNRKVQHLSLIMLWITGLIGCLALASVLVFQSARDTRLLGLTVFVIAVAVVTTTLVVHSGIEQRQRKRAREAAKQKFLVTYLPPNAYKPKPPLNRVKHTKR